MMRLFKAFLYKISRDLTFRITLIIGAGIAVLMTAIYLGIDLLMQAEADGALDMKYLTGQSMLVNSMSPVQNFGIAIPVNLIAFTCLEFSQGTIRNKIIAGHSKPKIYVSLFISGLIFTFLLLFAYLGLCTAFGSIFGGFDLNTLVAVGLAGGYITSLYIWQMILLCIVTYISIVSFAIFISTVFRSIGPTIPVVMVTLMICYVSSTIVAALTLFGDSGIEGFATFLKIINPLYALGAGPDFTDEGKAFMETSTMISGIVNNLVYAAIFFAAGILIFSKRDVK